MAAPKATIMLDIIEEHLEEFEFLWGQRQKALRSPIYTMRELADLEERIEAHVQGLLVGPDHALPLLEPDLAGDKPAAAFRAAYVLLRLKAEAATARVLEAFTQAEGDKLDALRQALCQGPLASLGPVQRALTSAPALAVAAAEVLAFKGQLDPKATAFDALLKHPEPAIRQAAWRCVAHCPSPLPAEKYRADLAHPDAGVVSEVLWAAAWHGQSWLLDHCRKTALAPANKSLQPAYLLAILGKPAEAATLRSAGKNPELGPRRFLALGAYGHPDMMELILEGMDSKDIPTALAAASAFTKITAKDIESNQRVPLPPADGKELSNFDKEFQEQVKLPDRALARRHWKEVEAKYRQGTRWCRGLNLSAGPPSLRDLDLESRWEACLRGKFEGTWTGSPADLEVFPQKETKAV